MPFVNRSISYPQVVLGRCRRLIGGRIATWRDAVIGRLGIEGKLLVCFMSLLSIGLGASCWMFLDMPAPAWMI